MDDILVHSFEKIVSKAVRAAIREVIDDAYLAGIFDGEGSVYLNDGRWRVCVVNNYGRIPERFKERFGGSLRERKPGKPHHKVAWDWTGSGYSAQRMAEALLPFLEIKRERIEKAMGENWGLEKTEWLNDQS